MDIKEVDGPESFSHNLDQYSRRFSPSCNEFSIINISCLIKLPILVIFATFNLFRNSFRSILRINKEKLFDSTRPTSRMFFFRFWNAI